MIKITYGETTIEIHRPWWRRLGNAPFEFGLALFAAYSGIAGFFNFGASNEIFTDAVFAPTVFNLIFVAAGIAMIIGLAARSRVAESFGLFGIMGALLTRIVVILLSTGWNVTSHNLLAICIIFTMASMIRLVMLPRPEHYVIT